MVIRHLTRCAVLLLALSGCPAFAAQYWQLVFNYDAQKLTVERADEIAPMAKQVRSPALESAPLRIACDVTWLDGAGQSLASEAAELPLGVRAIMADGLSCQDVIPESSSFVVRMAGPVAGQKPKALRLVRKGVAERRLRLSKAPAPLQFSDVTLPIGSVGSVSLAAGPVGSAKIRDTGPDSNRLVFVVMGDGYTAANLQAGTFTSHAGNMVTAFLNRSPWDAIFNATNVYRVDVESNEEGADIPQPAPGTYADTYLNTSFWVGGTERLLAITDSAGYNRAYAAADQQVGVGVWDSIIVLVNSTKYGGSGGTISVASVHSLSNEIVLHEIGHSFGNLADEYETGATALPSNDSEPNVDFDFSGTALKWNVWVESGTPLPTPETSQYDTVMGAFEGAKYWPTGVYRPFNNCEMRSLSRPFCSVCKEAHVVEFGNVVSFVGPVTPSGAGTHNVSGPTVFTIDPPPVAPLTIEWFMSGTLIPGQNGTQLTVTGADMPSSNCTLSATVTFDSPLVRKVILRDTAQWNLTRTMTAVDPAVWTTLY